MLYVQTLATAIVIVASLSVAAAEQEKDRVSGQPVPSAKIYGDSRPIRVVLPAPWESNNAQADARLDVTSNGERH